MLKPFKNNEYPFFQKNSIALGEFTIDVTSEDSSTFTIILSISKLRTLELRTLEAKNLGQGAEIQGAEFFWMVESTSKSNASFFVEYPI